jgi:multiubiquitin
MTQKEKTVTIIVNGREKEVEKGDLSYEQVVNLAFNNNPPQGPNIVITVTYSKGEKNGKQGSLLPGDTVKVKDGMIFNVTATDKS